MEYKEAFNTLKPTHIKPVTFTERQGLEWSSRTGLAKMQYYDFNTCKEARIFRRQEYNALHALPFLNEEQAKRFNKLVRLVIRDSHVAFDEDRK